MTGTWRAVASQRLRRVAGEGVPLRGRPARRSATSLWGVRATFAAPVGAHEPVDYGEAVGTIEARGNPSSSRVVTSGLHAGGDRRGVRPWRRFVPATT